MLFDGLAVPEQVSQSRHSRAVRVGTLSWLVNLLRVAQQDQVLAQRTRWLGRNACVDDHTIRRIP